MNVYQGIIFILGLLALFLVGCIIAFVILNKDY